MPTANCSSSDLLSASTSSRPTRAFAIHDIANSNLNETALINETWLPSGILSIMQYFQKTQQLNPKSKIKKRLLQ